ncbi:predicted protein [Naegleria gruberi]|uniref:Predicted protein n=1 Tax=Naegleria gruberi TaxID=5762 RepID=D2VCJ9_NAEGR|nr:uncharacterized protein NAEGRDRAFT_79440 [Naegleria gruberi]EFC45326.1 predicted protein [Naegleria gruberi]|eukprot:XP_002678070.1 predicted protein [Naegleria gruberi strain NEG-M]
MINLTPRKASRNSVSSFPSPDSLPQQQEQIEAMATPQSIINPPSSIHQQSSAFVTPTSSSFNNDINREGTMYSQFMNTNNASNSHHHQYSFKPSTTSSYLKPFMSYFFAHRKNIHDNPSNKKGESIWPERIVYIIGSIIFFTLSSVILINVLNFMFRQKTLPKSSSAKDVIYFLIGEVCTTLLLVVIRLFFNLENSDYDPSITKHRHKISQHGAEVGVLFEYFTLEEREILFYLSNVSIYLIGYATNSLCYAILFELIIVQAGSKYGFFKKDLLGLCVVLANIFCVFLGWFNVRMNDSLEVFLISCSADSVLPEESVFILPKFSVLHTLFSFI